MEDEAEEALGLPRPCGLWAPRLGGSGPCFLICYAWLPGHQKYVHYSGPVGSSRWFWAIVLHTFGVQVVHFCTIHGALRTFENLAQPVMRLCSGPEHVTKGGGMGCGLQFGAFGFWARGFNCLHWGIRGLGFLDLASVFWLKG